MADEKQPDNSDAGKSTTPEMVQIDKAELEEMQAAKEFRDTVRGRAKSILGDNFNEGTYFEDIEEMAAKTIEYEDELGKLKSSQPANPAQPKQPEKPVPAGLSEEDRRLIQQANSIATTSAMASHWTDFRLHQSILPEDSRSGHSKTELMKVMAGPKKAMFSDLLTDPQFDGNMFLVADYLLNESKGREERSKANSNSNEALRKAKTSARVSSETGGIPRGEVDEAKNLADAIAPSTVQ